jgi:hypothetical protein
LNDSERTVGAGYRKYRFEGQLIHTQEKDKLDEENETEVYHDFSEESPYTEAEKEIDNTGDNLMNSTFDVNEDDDVNDVNDVNQRSFTNLLVKDPQDFLRRWKLRPEMLNKLLTTDQIIVHIRSIKFADQFLANFLTLDFSQISTKRSFSKQGKIKKIQTFKI